MNKKKLKILAASAGSGKTYNLVQQFLEITLQEGQSSDYFAKVIAMTFTNKASLEMKERILEALDLIANPNRLTKSEQQKASDLIQKTSSKLKLQESFLTAKAKQVLSAILHNYGEYKVQTIDKFNLQLIKTFSRDLEVNEDFDVALNTDEVIEKVVDNILARTGKPEFKDLTHLVIQYAKSNLEEGEKWNFRQNLIDFAKILTKENNYSYVQVILNQSFDATTFVQLKNDYSEALQAFEHDRDELFNYFESLNLESTDIPYGTKGLYGILTKLKELQFPVPLTNSFAIKTIQGENIKPNHNVPHELIEKTQNYFEKVEGHQENLFVRKKLKDNFHNLALLKYISTELEVVKSSDNIVLISEFNQMISGLIIKENADFVYERLGNRYNHYLLDEFQDTSQLQWLNLVPLVHNSLGSSHQNLIVGDPKQAIYRFRNGVVEQFVALPRIYNPENDDEIEILSNYFENMAVKEPLNSNWRSKKTIVDFNNEFFINGLSGIPVDLQSYYSDVVQIPNRNEEGYVKFNLVSELNESEEKEFILESIRACEKDGFKRGEICLLARTGKQGNRWAKILASAEEKYSVESEDSLHVKSDLTVQVFIHYLNLRRNASNKTAQIRFVTDFVMLKKEDPIVVLNNYWINDKIGDLDFKKFITDYFDGANKMFFHYENLYDLGQKLSKLLGMSELNNPYLHHLMEMFQAYDESNGPDIRGFIDEWNGRGQFESVQIPKNDSSIKIMTIHKAKGLEFPVVLLPNLDWSLNPKDSVFITVDNENVIHTKLTKKNSQPSMALKLYEKEATKVFMDEFNLLYVAMTRPIERLYGLVKIYEPKNPVNLLDYENFGRISKMNNFVYQILMRSKGITKDNSLQFGSAQTKIHKHLAEDSKVFSVDLKDQLWFPAISFKDEQLMEREQLNEEARFGTQLHLLLEMMRSKQDLSICIQNLILEDRIEEKFRDALVEKANLVFSNHEFITLLNNADQILSEQDIITSDNLVLRPDLIILSGTNCVVLDYKSGIQRPEHQKQLNQYVLTLKSMGYSEVKGYLMYTEKAELLAVA